MEKKERSVGYCFIGIGHKKPRGGVVYVKLKMKQGHCIDDRADFAEGGDAASGRQGAKYKSI
jgi:hypothetical protein